MGGISVSSEFPVTIGKLSRYTKCSIDMIRYYEQIGLIPAPRRSAGNHRIYQETHFRQLLFVRQCRALDFSLDEIRSLSQLIDNGADCAKINSQLEAHLDNIRCSIVHLKKVELILKKARGVCHAKSGQRCPAVSILAEQYLEDLQPFRLSIAANLGNAPQAFQTFR